MAATEVVPRPLAQLGVVTHDVSGRALIVRRAEQASGRERLAWRTAYEGLVRAEQAGWPFSGAPQLWATGGGQERIAYAVPGEGLTLRFAFGIPSEPYAQLVSKPLSSFITTDLSTGFFVAAAFRHALR
jgi:hypothetical protein